jgi:ABC-type multidrug transport system fused ATPase/permease subunit
MSTTPIPSKGGTYLKSFLTPLKWLARKAQPFTISIILIIILNSISSLFSISIALVSKKLIDSASSGQGRQALLVATVYAIILFVNTFLQSYNSVLSTKTQERVSNKMREDFFIRLSKIKWLEISKYHSEDILTRMTSDIGTISNTLVNTIPSIFSLCILFAGSLISLILFEPSLALFAFLMGPIAVIFSRLFAGKLKNLHIKIQEAESKNRSFLQECIVNMLLIKSFCLEIKSIGTINKLQNEKLEWILKRNKLSVSSNSLLSLTFSLSSLIAFCWGAFRLSQGIITFGTLTAFLQLVGQVQGPFVGLAYTLPQIISTFGSLTRLREFDTLNSENNYSNGTQIDVAGVRYENVTFGYDHSKPVLKNISLKILPGEIVGIVGPSGKGKTTLIHLLLSLIEPDDGRISLTDFEGKIFDISSSTRNLISYVPQGNILFSGTIAENLRVVSPYASDEDLCNAAREACAWEFIEKLQDGLYTTIGERGLGLSEGQIQRLAIARALIRKSPILVLDEATSALDIKTEIEVLKNIQRQNPKKTCIIVTHRSTTLGICDRILKLDDGHIKDVSNKTHETSLLEIV